MQEAAIAEVMADCINEEERQRMLSRSALIKASLAKLTDTVEAKATAHQMLTEYLEACNAAKQKISKLLLQLQDDRLTADQISDLQTDLDQARSQLSQLESHSSELKTAVSRANVVIKDRTVQVTMDLDANIQKMLDHIDNVNYQLCAKGERLTEISEVWHMYNDTKTSVQSNLQELQESISAAEVAELSLAGIKIFMEHLLIIQKHWSESAASYEQLKSTNQRLSVLDPSSVDNTENELGHIETARNALESELSDSVDHAAHVVENWQSFDGAKCRVESVLTEAKSVLMKPTELDSLQALRERLAQIKVFLCCFCGFCEFCWFSLHFEYFFFSMLLLTVYRISGLSPFLHDKMR